MTKYDPSVIQQLADRLYRKAAATVLIFSLLGFAIGIYFGCASAGVFEQLRDSAKSLESTRQTLPVLTLVQYVVIAFFSLAFAFLGYVFGVERAFWLKLRAQTALCQLRVELNTRAVAKSLAQQFPTTGFPEITG